MFVRVAWGRLQDGTWEEYEKLYRDYVMARSDEVGGLRQRILLRSTTDADEGISLTFWDARDDMERYRSSPLYRDELVPRLEHVFKGEWWVKEFELRADTAR